MFMWCYYGFVCVEVFVFIHELWTGILENLMNFISLINMKVLIKFVN